MTFSCKAPLSNAHEILDTLKRFSNNTWQSINHDKTRILFHKNFHPRLKKYIYNMLKMKPISQSDSYLGDPLFLGDNKRAIFEHLIARVNARVKGWKSNLLSKSGKKPWLNQLLLLFLCTKCHASSSLNTFANLSTLFKETSGGVRRKWEKNILYLCSWKASCLPTKFGGLGIREFSQANLAAISCFSWRIITIETNLTTRILKANTSIILNRLFLALPKSTLLVLERLLPRNKKKEKWTCRRGH